MSAGPLTHVLVPTPPAGATTHTTTGAASSELDTSSGGRYRFIAATATAYLTFGPTGSVVAPTASNGIMVAAGTSVDFVVPRGWKFRVFAGSAGDLNWFRMAI